MRQVIFDQTSLHGDLLSFADRYSLPFSLFAPIAPFCVIIVSIYSVAFVYVSLCFLVPVVDVGAIQSLQPWVLTGKMVCLWVYLYFVLLVSRLLMLIVFSCQFLTSSNLASILLQDVH